MNVPFTPATDRDRLTGAIRTLIGRHGAGPVREAVGVEAPVGVEEWEVYVATERARQRIKWGDGHDREHGIDHLLTLAQDYGRRGEAVKAAALVQAARDLLATAPPVLDREKVADALAEWSWQADEGEAIYLVDEDGKPTQDAYALADAVLTGGAS